MRRVLARLLPMMLIAGTMTVTAPPAHASSDPVLVGAGDIAGCTSSGGEATAKLIAGGHDRPGGGGGEPRGGVGARRCAAGDVPGADGERARAGTGARPATGERTGDQGREA